MYDCPNGAVKLIHALQFPHCARRESPLHPSAGSSKPRELKIAYVLPVLQAWHLEGECPFLALVVR